MISFLHTSKIHIKRFEDLIRKFDTNCITKHYVDEDLLNYALKNKKVDEKSFFRKITTIKEEKPSLIICTCSTYGELCNETNQVKRIDFPVIDYLINNYRKIALVFTAKSTQKVSQNLIEETANHQQKNIEIIHCDCSDAWQYFENNNIITYEKTIAKKVKEIANTVDVIFLAQASMEGAKKYLQDIKPAVFTSPEFGIKSYLNK